MNNGFGHTELMATPEGPRLIEVNPRISGANGFINKLFRACGYPAQVDLLIASLENTITPTTDTTLAGRRVCLQNYRDHTIGHLNIELLKQLPSFKRQKCSKNPVHFYPSQKVCMIPLHLYCWLMPFVDQITQDYQQLMTWERVI